MSHNFRMALISGSSLILTLALSISPARAADMHPHGHDCATATQINLNQDERVLLTDSRDFAVYRIVLDRRGLIDIWTDPGSFDVWGMDLLNASCEPVPRVSGGTSAITGGYSKITVPTFKVRPGEDVFTLEPGVYYIRMHPDPGRVFQDAFTVHNKFIPHFGHDCGTAEPIALSSATNGALLYDKDREVFQFTADKPGRVHVWTLGAFAPADAPEIGLFFGDCSSAIEQLSSDETDAGITGTILDLGTYYVAVQPFGSKSLGPFTLRLKFEAAPERPRE